jgi:hypothetical protein
MSSARGKQSILPNPSSSLRSLACSFIISCRCLGRGAVEPALRLRFLMAVLCYRIADGVR